MRSAISEPARTDRPAIVAAADVMATRSCPSTPTTPRYGTTAAGKARRSAARSGRTRQYSGEGAPRSHTSARNSGAPRPFIACRMNNTVSAGASNTGFASASDVPRFQRRACNA